MTLELIVLLSLLGITVLLVVAIWAFSRFVRKDGVMSEIALQKEQELAEGYIGVPADMAKYVGKRGVALTVLRPSGKIKIEGTMLDAVSVRDFIDVGVDVIVTKYENTQLYVERFDNC